MSIEEQLSKAFKHSDSSLHCPPSLDIRIKEEYEQMVMGKTVQLKRKGKMPKIAAIALVVVLLCGFAYGSKFLFSDSTNFLSYEFYSSEAYDLKQETFEEARAAIKQVQSQLKPGEAAIVYLPEALKEFPLYPVTKPDYISNKHEWQLVLDEQGITEQLPDSLLEASYQFEAGAINNYPVIGLDQHDLIAEMEAEKKISNSNQPIWRLTDLTTNSSMPSYISVYRAENGEAIHLTLEVHDEVVKLEGFTSTGTEYEEYNLNGKKAHYTKNNQALLGDSGVLQNVMWMEEKDGKTIIYNVESDSLNMTKEKLLEAVRSLP